MTIAASYDELDCLEELLVEVLRDISLPDGLDWPLLLGPFCDRVGDKLKALEQRMREDRVLVQQ